MDAKAPSLDEFKKALHEKIREATSFPDLKAALIEALRQLNLIKETKETKEKAKETEEKKRSS